MKDTRAMNNLNLIHLKDIVSRFHRAKVLVVGDLILDEFIWGAVSRISPEAPVPVVWVDSENFMPGGASNVAHNIRSLGGEVHLAGVVGNDERGRILRSLLEKKGVRCEGIFVDRERPTTQKTRVIAHHQQVVRIDREQVKPVSDTIIKKIIKLITGKISSVDALIIEDYGKGVITSDLVREAVKAASRHKKIISVDPKEDHFSYYRGVTTITPNHHEAGSAVGYPVRDDSSLEKAGRSLLRRLNCESVLITLGESGMALFQKAKKMVKIPTIARDVFDVSGAGDTVISAYTLARSCDGSALEAAHISNCAAGIVVGKVGVAVTHQRELLEHMTDEILKNGKGPWKPSV
jgi:D-beta-D-heptose 7-phosphate kinase/D-beta-D-heptose 1-phosphate adenosyltransferase